MSADTLPRKIVDLNVTIARRTAEQAGQVARIVVDHTGRALGACEQAGRTVVGQLRSTGERTAGTAGTQARTVVGQARAAGERTAEVADRTGREAAGQIRAQGEAASEAVEHEAHRAVDRSRDAVADTPGRGVPYEKWTKAELYERAQELDVDGRAGMNKAELVRALRAAG